MKDRWVFGYGSLIFRPAFPFAEQAAGFVEGWSRRWWQGSTDHRGVPGAPGRVVMAIAEPEARLWGMAFRVAAARVPEVFERLDHREKGGYAQHEVSVQLGGGHSVVATMYVATPDNPNFLGPAPLEDMVRQVLGSEGPSGTNVEYVLKLAEALRAMRVDQDETLALAREIYVKLRSQP